MIWYKNITSISIILFSLFLVVISFDSYTGDAMMTFWILALVLLNIGIRARYENLEAGGNHYVSQIQYATNSNLLKQVKYQ